MNSKSKKIGVIVLLATAILATLIATFWEPSESEESYVVLSKIAVGEQWIQDNQDIIVSADGSEDCAVIVDVSKISPQTFGTVSRWLTQFKDSICYPESYEYIEKVHRVTSQAHIDTIIRNQKNTESLALLNQLITNPKYGNYIFFKKDSKTGIITPTFKNGYTLGDVSLSCPSILSITNCSSNQFDPTLYTVTYSMYSNNSQIGFIIKDLANTKVYYYNYSTDPTKPTPTFL